MVFRTGNIIACALFAVLVLAPNASAWAWPVDGPVLRPFVADGDPYAGGQHRGIDIGAPSGEDVGSATNGVVSFVGQLPHQGLCLTVRTADGYSVTLVHLGSIGVTTGTQVAEGDVVGTIGPTGDVEGTEPYVYLGIRLTADPNGYLDPLTLLPPRQTPERPPVTQPQAPAPQQAPPSAQANPPRAEPVHAKSKALAHASSRPAPAPRSPGSSVAPPGRSTSPRNRADRSPVVRASAPRTARPPVRPGPPSRSAGKPAAAHAYGHAPPSESAGRRSVGGAARTSPPVQPTTRRDGSRRMLLLAMALAGLALLAIGVVRGRRSKPTQPRPVGPRPLRKMSVFEPVPEERLPEPSTTAHSRRRRVALRQWPAASRTCRRLRRPVGHHRPLSPASGRLRADGQRNRRARNAGHGRRRSRGAVSA